MPAAPAGVMLMRINVTTLKEIVNANRQAVQQQAQKCQSQIETLNWISTDSGICDSKAYRSMFDYLRRVKVPALMQQVVFLEAYVTDMQTDLDRLSELETDGSGILDTDELTHQLNNLRLINDDIARWIERNREQNPTACFHVTQVMQGNQDFMAHLQQQIDLALTYGSDSSIYASSALEMEILDRASAALEAVHYDSTIATYDLSKADLSWTTADLVGTYTAAVQKLGASGLSGDLMKTVIMTLMGESGECCAYGGDPVNLATGNFIYHYDSLVFESRPRMLLRLFYNSHNRKSSSLGRGWTHSFSVSLSIELNRAIVTMEDGHAEIFLGTTENGFEHLLGRANTLTRKEDGYVYTTPAGIKYRFDAQGRCLSVLDRLGRGVFLDYEGNLLIGARNTRGPAIHFAYDAEGRMTHAYDTTKRCLDFSYEENGLVGIKTGSGITTLFSYDEHRYLATVTNARGITELCNAFDPEGRVTRQEFADGGVISYAYDDARMQVIATNQLENKFTYIHDGLYRTIEVRTGDLVERLSYSEKNLKTRIVNPRGLTSRYRFDEVGNLVCVRNPLNECTTYKYNAFNEPIHAAVDGITIFQNEYDELGQITKTIDATGNETLFSHDENGDIASVTHADGSITTFEHNMLGLTTAVTGPQGTTEYTEFNEHGLPVVQTDGSGNKTGYEYDESGNVTSVINAEGNRRSYEYDAVGLLMRMIDYDGVPVSYAYDDVGRPIRFTDKDGHEHRREYDLAGHLIKSINAAGATTTFEYDAKDNLTKMTDALGNSTSFEYDPNGNRIRTLLPDGTSTLAAYDQLDRVCSVCDGLGNTTHYQYDVMGNLVHVVDPMKNHLTWEYDAACRLLSGTDAMGRTTTYEYTALGALSRITDAAQRTTSYKYLPGGLPHKVINPDGTSLTFGFDAAGNIATKTSQNGYELSYSYDVMKRVTQISNNQGQKKSYRYDAVGNQVSKTDGRGNTTIYAYTSGGNLEEVIEASGAVTRYGYDATGNLICVERLGIPDTDAENTKTSHARITTYEHDPLGRIICITDALGHSEHLSYDVMGRLVARTDADGFTTLFDFDGAGRMSCITFADGRVVHMTHDPLSRLIELHDWLGTTSFAYDAVGNMIHTRDHADRELNYTWGLGNEIRSITYPGGMQVSYDYDEILRLSGVHANKIDIAYRYDTNGWLSTRSYSNGTGVHFGYDVRGRLTHLSGYDAKGPLDEFSYAYDLCDNTSIVHAQRRDLPEFSGTYTYRYDELNRLTQVSQNDRALRSYEYDSFGNRTKRIDAHTGTTDYTYNALDQLIRSKDVFGKHIYHYDARGNLILEETSEGTAETAYEYDALNLLSHARLADGREAHFTYDGMLRRYSVARRTAEGATSILEYVLDPTRSCNNLIQTFIDGQLDQSYLWDTDNLLAIEIGDSQTASVVQDPLGSILRILDNSSISSSFAYDEFGNSVYDDEQIHIPFAYTGYLKDGITRSLYAQARQYLPNIGRFTSADPLHGCTWQPSTINRYIYCCQQPLDFIDLLGLSREEAVEYARRYATDIPFLRNPDYPMFWQNCANFVSQSLHAGGIPMNDDWYCSPTTEFSLPGATLFYRGGFLFGVISEPSPQGILCLSSSLGIYLGTLGIAKIQARSNRQSGNDIWADGNWTSGKVYFHSSTWSAAQNHYNYFSDPTNGYINSVDNDVINIPSVASTGFDNTKKSISEASKTVKPGDLVYWVSSKEGVHHATIVTEVQDGKIQITGNTKAYKDESLAGRMKDNPDQTIVIIHLKDQCFNE